MEFEQQLESNQHGEVYEAEFSAKMVKHAAVRIAHYISYYKKNHEWPEIAPTHDQIEATIENFSKSDGPDDLDCFYLGDTIDSSELTTQALFDLVKKNGKFRIYYLYRDGQNISAEIDVLFRGFEFEVYFHGKDGKEIWDHDLPLKVFEADDRYIFYDGKNFDMF